MTQRKELSQFGLLLSGILAGVFGVLLPLLKSHPIPVWPFFIALPLCTLALLKPLWLQPIYTLWMKLGAVLGWINTRILLSILFYGILFPIGLIKRLVSEDPLHRQFEKQAPTYKTVSTPRPAADMEKPY